MTIITQTQLVAPSFLAITDTILYTSPTNTTTKLGSVVFVNESTSPVTLTTSITSTGITTSANTLTPTVSLAPGERYLAPELRGQVILAGSTLNAYASVASSVVVAVSGFTIK